MKLLDDIVDGATEDEETLSNLLRKCLVLAHRLNNEKLKTWVEKELDGYDDDDEMPQYRVIRAQAKGVLFGPLQGVINDQPLSPHILEKEHRHWAQEARLNGPIASYEKFANPAEDDGNPRILWPAAMVAYYQSKFMRDWTLNRAWIEIPTSSMRGLADSVRNRILRLALELKSELGTVEDDPQKLPPAKVDQQVINIIYGGQNVIGSTAEQIVQSTQSIVIENDVESLLTAFKELGVSEPRLKELLAAIEDDAKKSGAPTFGERTKAWLKNLSANAGAAGLKVAADVATKVGTKMLLQYFGIPGA